MAEKPFSQFPRITVPKASDLLGISRDLGGGYVTEHIELDQLGVQLGYIKLVDRQAVGAVGGASVAGYQDRVLNTEDFDTGDDCTLSGNQFTLQPGTYIIDASAPCNGGDNHQIDLFNVTDTAIVLAGATAFANSAQGVETRSRLVGRFTITEAKTFKIRHWVLVGKAVNGLGSNSGSNPLAPVFTQVELFKTASQTVGEDPRGSMVYLGEFTVNAGLITCQGVLTGGYKKFQIELVELDAAANYGVQGRLMNGGSVISDAFYYFAGMRAGSSGVSGQRVSLTTSWNLSLQASVDPSTPNQRILMDLEARSGGTNIRLDWTSSIYHPSSFLEVQHGTGMYGPAVTYDGLQFEGITSALTAGKARVWGIKG